MMAKEFGFKPWEVDLIDADVAMAMVEYVQDWYGAIAKALGGIGGK
jgi:hypothetical protein